MATIDRYGKGSILYKLLIVLLTAALVVSIIYPKSLWDREARHQEICRNRMSTLYNAELQYQGLREGFSGSPAALITFIKSDAQYLHRIDSLIVQPINTAIKTLDSLRQIQVLADTLIGTLITSSINTASVDSAVIDSVDRLEDDVIWGSRSVRRLMEAIRERMVNFPNMPIPTFDKGLEIIERKDYFFNMEVVKRMLIEGGNLPEYANGRNLQVARVSSDSALQNFNYMDIHLKNTLVDIGKVPGTLDSLYFCPTFHDSLKIVLADSGVFRFANIYCPIDSVDIRSTKTDFFKHRIGALKIVNHGHIVKNEKSWEQQR